jgi:regulator of RNase E activity RraA
MDRAVLGGNVAIDIVSRGIVGVVVDGVVRDLDELEELGLPVFARGVTPRSGSDLSGRGEVLGPIACGRVAVMPGDVVIGDNDGVVVVPRHDAGQVAARAHSVQQRKGSADDLAERLASARAGRVTAYDTEQLHRDLLASGLVEWGHPWSA